MADENKPKPGFFTTEFWASIGTAALGICVVLGFFTPAEASDLISIGSKVVGGIMSSVPIVGYAISRAKTKQAPQIDLNSLVKMLGDLAKEKEESK